MSNHSQNQNHTDQLEAKRIEMIEDVGRRLREASDRADRLRKSQFELMNQASRATELGDAQGGMTLRAQSDGAGAEFRRINHIEIPGLHREFESIQNGHHASIAVLGGALAAQSRKKQREDFEDAQKHFSSLVTPELKEAARRLIELAQAHLENPPAAAVAIAHA